MRIEKENRDADQLLPNGNKSVEINIETQNLTFV